MLSFDPIDRHKFRFVMLIAFGLLVILTANIGKFLEVSTLFINCRNWGTLCLTLTDEVPAYFTVIAISLFMITLSIATLRRVLSTPISNYWAVFVSILVFLDHRYLSGLGVLWSGNPIAGLFEISAPWFLLAAIALILLLLFASDNSTYFMQGYWNADPPLGWALSVSSFWLLALSAPKMLIVVADAIDNFPLALATARVQENMEMLLPKYITAPVVPAIIFAACAVMLIVLGRFNNRPKEDKSPASRYRLQSAVQTTRAAQRLNGLKL